MFTGIITDIGTIIETDNRGDLRVKVRTGKDQSDAEYGASIACSGVCLTVVDKFDEGFFADVSTETLVRSAPDFWTNGRALNLERSLKLGDELGGHLVTGHVDGTGRILSVNKVGDSYSLDILLPGDLAPFVAAKGSLTIDGVSLTVNEVRDEAQGSIAKFNIIGHTAQNTTLGERMARVEEQRRGRAAMEREALDKKDGSSAHKDRRAEMLHLEIDILSRYLSRMSQFRDHIIRKGH